MSLRLIPVQPVGTTRSAGFACGPRGCVLDVFESPQYPAHPQGRALRDARVDAHMSLGELARALGIRAVELSELEHGRLTTDAPGWEECMAAVKGAANG
jgi:hypothetical protein